MKKTLLVALSLLVGLSVSAQISAVKPTAMRSAKSNTFVSAPTFQHRTGAKDAVVPEWSQIGTPFTAYDIDNNEVDIEAILSSGKAIVIDYAATWCPWCWRIHNSGNLGAIQSALGSSVQVLWVECDASTTVEEIRGEGSQTQGDWTHNSDNTGVNYPIIDCATCDAMVGGVSGLPSIYFIAPNGFYCDIYGTDWGFSYTTSNDNAVAAIQYLLNNYPQSGQVASNVHIDGFTSALLGSTRQYSIAYTSVDPVNSIEWTIDGGTPSTATGESVDITWETLGTHTINCTVTNDNGDASASLDVNVFEWNWGDEMDYTNGGEFDSSIGRAGDGEIQWGVMYPAALLTGRNYVTKVSTYVKNSGDYDLIIYQGGNNAPSTQVYEHTYSLTTTAESGEWIDMDIFGGLAIDPTQNLWVTLHTDGVNYPASYTDYSGDPNGSWLYNNGSWYYLWELVSDYNNTWMIKTTTSVEAPDFDFALSGATTGYTDDVLEFSVSGPNDATYTWTLDGATPATATGMTASASWANAGTYTITVNGARSASATATHTMQVTITDCEAPGLPYLESFESGLGCWTAVDADGDGHNWLPTDQLTFTPTAHTGEGVVGSPSWVSGVGVLNTDNWLISPKIHIPAEGATIEWWDWGQDVNDFADHYYVMTSTNSRDIADFTGIEYEGAPAEARVWTQHSRSLNAFAGQDIYIAFRHQCSNMFWLLLDDVKITAGNTSGIDNVEQASVSVYPNPTTGRFHITANGFENVEVFDVTGRNVMNASCSVIDLSAFANGVYTLRVNTTTGSSMYKIVKK